MRQRRAGQQQLDRVADRNRRIERHREASGWSRWSGCRCVEVPESDATVRAGVPPVGVIVSTVAVTAAVVVVLPAVSVASAVKLWLPLASAAVVKFQLPALTVAVPSKVAPS